MATYFTWAYRSDGLPSVFGQPNGNATDLTYDLLGHPTGSDADTSGGTDRSNYDWTVNRAGQVLSEAATVTGDASNGTVTYGYDPLGRLVGATLAGTTTAYGWDKVPNRTSVQVGAGTAVTTSYNNADRPTTDSAGGAYSSDDDGRLTARPGQQLTWDRLGRLAQVKNGSGTVLASYTYDPLDRLRLIDYGGGVRIRFRYVGLTTAVAQWLDDAAGTVTRSVGTGWSGERLLDWTGTGANIRVYGTNGHHDTTWLASSTGTVSQSLRYDPWGSPRSAVPSGYSPFRFQGSYLDATTDLAWVVTRWYAPSLGRFVSEDSLLGEPADPPSRHLYAYGQGEPIARWDPDGRFWYKVKAGDTLKTIASKKMFTSRFWPMIFNANRKRKVITSSIYVKAGACLWVPLEWVSTKSHRSSSACSGPRPAAARRAERSAWGTHGAPGPFHGGIVERAAQTLDIYWGFLNLDPAQLNRLTKQWTGRARSITKSQVAGEISLVDGLAKGVIKDAAVRGTLRGWNGLVEVYGNSSWPAHIDSNAWAFTFGHYIFYDGNRVSYPPPRWLRSHEYVHVLQFEGKGAGMIDYALRGTRGPRNPYEAIGYVWQGYTYAYGVGSYDKWERPN